MVTSTVDKLTANILESKAKLDLQTQHIDSLKAELKKFVDSNINLRIPVSQTIKNDSGLLPNEILEEMTRLDNLEVARVKKLENFERASELFKEKIKQAEGDLKVIQANLNNLEDEQDWQDNYSPEASKYQEFFVTQAIEEFNRKLADHEFQLHKGQAKIQIIERYLRNPQAKQQTCTLEYQRAFNYSEVGAEKIKINGNIEGLQNAIEDLKAKHELFLNSLHVNRDFRKFIRHRVNINQSANELLLAQNDYLKKLEVFSGIKRTCKAAIALPEGYSVEFAQMFFVSIGDKIEISVKDISI